MENDQAVTESQNKVLALSVADRLLLSACLPQQGGRIRMRLVSDLASHLDFTPEEIQLLSLRDHPQGGFAWNRAAEIPIRFEVTPDQILILKECLEEADRREIIGMMNLSMVDMIERL